jgi:TRAP-type C4-dicarboxylate transport system permease small subunit
MMQKLENAFVAANRWALIVMLGAMAAIVFTNVVLRYTVGESLFWAEEVSRYLMIWLTLLGTGLVLRHGGHIAIDNLQDALPGGTEGRAAQALRVLNVLLMLVFFVGMIIAGWQYCQRTMFQTAAATQLPMAYVYAALPIGFALCLVHLGFVVRRYVLARQFMAQDGFDAQAASSL